MGIARHLTCQIVALKVCSLHSNATAREMPFPKCLFPDEMLLLIYKHTTSAWKLRDIHKNELSGDHQPHDAARASSLCCVCS